MDATETLQSRKRSPRKPTREVELKLEVASGDPLPLLKHPVIARAKRLPAKSGRLRAVYYDTEDQALRRAGISLRLRREGGGTIQTMKAQSRSRGLALDRGEWNQAVDGGLDLAAFGDTPLARFMADEAARARIVPAFTVDTRRRTFAVERDGSLIELSLDRALARSGRRSSRFAEVELELKRGHPAALYAVARDLSGILPLRLSSVTKSDRGYALGVAGPGDAVRASRVKLAPGTPCAEAFQIIARSCLAQVVANEAILRGTGDAGALHQTRVGLRRLRAAISLFKTVTAGKETRHIGRDLGWAARQLAAVRDLDVLLAGAGEDAQAEDWADARRRRSDAWAELKATLESPRFLQTILDTAAWIEAGDWLLDPKPGRVKKRARPVERHAAKELQRRWKRVRKQSAHIDELGEEKRHGLRIRIKKLRYGVEFFEALFRKAPQAAQRAPLLRVLERLQDLLGALNDLAVGQSLDAARLDARQAKRLEARLLAKAVGAGGRLRALAPFWR